MKSNKLNSVLITVIVILIVTFAAVLLLNGNEDGEEKKIVQVENTIPVETMKADNSSLVITREYLGVMKPMPMQEISVNELRTVEKVYVKTGMEVKEGDPLIKFKEDNEDDELLDDFFDQLDKKEDAYDEKEDAWDEYDAADEDDEDFETLKSDYDKAVREYDSEKKEYDRLKEECAEYFIFCDVDGYVADVKAAPRQYAYPNQTLIAIGSGEKTITIGVYANEVKHVEKGKDASIFTDESKFDGSILYVNELPNPETNTYETTVVYNSEGNDFAAGELATVSLALEEKSGIWIPFSVILNDGQDYVYVVNNSTALKRYLHIQAVSENMALVEGLSAGEMIVSGGMNKLSAGAVVSTVSKTE